MTTKICCCVKPPRHSVDFLLRHSIAEPYPKAGNKNNDGNIAVPLPHLSSLPSLIPQRTAFNVLAASFGIYVHISLYDCLLFFLFINFRHFLLTSYYGRWYCGILKSSTTLLLPLPSLQCAKYEICRFNPHLGCTLFRICKYRTP